MNRLLAHRGPDDHGIYHDPANRVTLAMRRLSIMDLEHGQQPMANDDRSLVIVYNGEIFNAPDLRRQIEGRNHRFTTVNSDTEVLLKLYEEKQADMLADLNGMFAFVIYDRRRSLLFGARDPMGIKPLYYMKSPNRFTFASELKSLLIGPAVTRELDAASLFHYLTLRFVPGEQTIFKGMSRLAPGHAFQYHLHSERLDIRPYWRPRFPQEENRSLDEWSDLIRLELKEAVQRWSLSDVPIGCSLSGGLDSSSIVGLLAESGHRHIKTYSLGFAGEQTKSFDELPLARKVAERWGTDHHEVILQPEDLLRDLIKMVWHLDEPYGGGLPSWYVFQFMSQHVKVGLTGTGGDELFGDYGRFVGMERYGDPWTASGGGSASARGTTVYGRVLEPLLACVPERLVGWRTRERWLNWRRIAHDPFRWEYVHAFYYLSDAMKRAAVLSDGAESQLVQDTADFLRGYCRETVDARPRNALMQLAMQTQLPEEFLFMTDRFSMAHSLEARVPFLDRTFIDLVMRIPPEIRTTAGDPKYLLRRAVREVLPPDLLAAPKRGFVIPVAQWLRGPLRPLAERLLSPERLVRQNLFRPEFYVRFVRPHLEGRADYHAQVWTALMFQLWHVEFIEQGADQCPAYAWQDLCR
jgi:asparagine synthase (glutamine-hydrolysing)